MNPIRKSFEINKQQIALVLSREDELSVQGQRLRNQPESFWLYYSGYKTANENQSTTIPVQQSTRSVRDDDKASPIENTTTRWYHQVSRNVNTLNRSTAKGNSFTTSFPLPMQSSVESDRPITAPIAAEENTRRMTSLRNKASAPARAFNPPVVDLSGNIDQPIDSHAVPCKPKPLENITKHVAARSLAEYVPEPAVVRPPPVEIKEEIPIEKKPTRRNSQTKANGFQHIANLGSWQRHSKTRADKPPQVDYDDDFVSSDQRIYEYKSPFPEEYDQAISLQAQLPITNDPTEWNIKDFYRDVKSPLEPATNSKSVFEKCLRLSRLQANTIKWEQRRRQNLITYNRLMKNASLDTNLNSLPTNLTDLKRELRCNECKRISCLGNCAPGQDYHQYKRVIPFTALSANREPIRAKYNLRTQRSMVELRPRSQQMVRPESSTGGPMLAVPVSDDESTPKYASPPSTTKKPTQSGFLPGRSFRPQRRDTLTYFSSHKISS